VNPIGHAAYALAWLAFGVVHSATAGATRRAGLGRLFGRGHRLGYNLIALTGLALVFTVGRVVGHDAQSLPRPLPVEILQIAMLVLGGGIGLVALRSYRAGPFVGWAQLRGEEDDTQDLVVSGLHRWMRHPLYTAAILLLWGAVRDELGLATAVWATVYFYVGSIFEERRLVARYGNRYSDFRSTVPRFFPRLRTAMRLVEKRK
jgi:protein-S-isoprenylcysteine O-methyltransferase Ste14